MTPGRHLVALAGVSQWRTRRSDLYRRNLENPLRQFRIAARPGALSLPVAAGLLLALASPAFGDIVHNSVVASDGIRTVDVLPGQSTTVDYYVQATGNDDCNASDGTPLTVNVVAPAAVGVSTGSLVFSACHQGGDKNWQSITFTAPAVAGSYLVSVTTADSGGGQYNTEQGSFTLVVAALQPTDTTPPALGLPADTTVEATGPAGATVTYTATATDDTDGTVPVTCSPASGATFALGTTTVTCTASDNAGNSALGTFAVTVVDTTAPVLSLPADIVMTGGLDGAVVTYAATAVDLVDGNRPVACSTPSGSTVLGSTTVTCTAADTRGNTAGGTFTISVTYGFGGFLSPSDTKANGMKAGSTAPVRFQLTDGQGGYIRDPRAIEAVGSGVIACGASGEAAPLGDYATGGTSLRYDTATEQWIYNWQSPKKAGCFAVRFTLHDGTVHQVSFVTR
jgi:hypothetical protein